MKSFDHKTMRWLLLALLALLLNACSDDSEEANKQYANFEAQCGTSWYVEEHAEARSVSGNPFGITTRTGETSWAPTDVGYYPYETLINMFVQQKELMYKSIDVFLTKDDPFTDDHKNYLEGDFSYRNSTGKWSLSLDEIKTGEYFLYGFIPKEVASSASIEGNSTFSEGAVLTINELKTITFSDVCVIVGAKEGDENNSYLPTGLKTGQFAVHANAAKKTDATPSNNYIYLLFDHLYTGLRFRFTVDNDYYALRTIKLTKLELRGFKDDNETKAKAQYDAIITLKKTPDETVGNRSPIQSVVFSPVASSADSPYEALYEGDEVEIEHGVDNQGNINYTNFMGCFVPGETTYFRLRSTYNVYDKKGTLVREGCEAENTFDIRNMFKILELSRGHMYSLSIKIQPTYLYMLSEPDLDNPTMKIN